MGAERKRLKGKKAGGQQSIKTELQNLETGQVEEKDCGAED